MLPVATTFGADSNSAESQSTAHPSSSAVLGQSSRRMRFDVNEDIREFRHGSILWQAVDKTPAPVSKAAASSKAGARHWVNTYRQVESAPATSFIFLETFQYRHGCRRNYRLAQLCA